MPLHSVFNDQFMFIAKCINAYTW